MSRYFESYSKRTSVHTFETTARAVYRCLAKRVHVICATFRSLVSNLADVIMTIASRYSANEISQSFV